MELQKAIAACAAGDVLLVPKLDRLGRTMEDCVSRVAELLDNGPFGTLLQCQQRSDWPLQLQQLQGHDHPPAPLLQFPATQPNLTDVLESLHKRLGIWADQRKPVL